MEFSFHLDFIDPFTGHESSGNLRNKVKGFIKGQALNVYENEIIQFNNIMDEKNHLLEEFLEFDFIKNTIYPKAGCRIKKEFNKVI